MTQPRTTPPLLLMCLGVSVVLVACSAPPMATPRTPPDSPAAPISPAVPLATAAALHVVAPVGAPAGEIARQLTLAYPGGSTPLTITASHPGDDGNAGVMVFDSYQGQVGTVAVDGGPVSQPFQYASAEPGIVTLQLYNWGGAPVDVAIVPNDLRITRRLC